MDFLRDDELIVEQYAVGYFNDERLKKQLRKCMPRWLLSKLFVYGNWGLCGLVKSVSGDFWLTKTSPCMN